MRPRKRILLYCDSLAHREELSFQLDLWGYAVFAVPLDGIAAAVRSVNWSLVLLIPSVNSAQWAKMVEDLAGTESMETVVRIYDLARRLPRGYFDDCVLREMYAPTAEALRSELATAMARKRGPRPNIAKLSSVVTSEAA